LREVTRRDSFSSYAQDANAEVTTDGRAKSKTRNGRAGFLRGLKARLIEKKAVASTLTSTWIARAINSNDLEVEDTSFGASDCMHCVVSVRRQVTLRCRAAITTVSRIHVLAARQQSKTSQVR
jgi:hypothetical protein